MTTLYHPTKTDKQYAPMTPEAYEQLYQESITNPEFFAPLARERLVWQQDFTETYKGNFTEGQAEWFTGGTLNVSENCIDRHLETQADKVAIIWESDAGDETKHITYAQLAQEVNTFANVLKKRGVKRGDRVCIYMPMIPEATYAMLACARIGAIHSVVFGGFSAQSIRDRVIDAGCDCIITADAGYRGGKVVPLKANVDSAIEDLTSIHSVIVVRRMDKEFDVMWELGRDCWYHELAPRVENFCRAEPMNSEDSLFILYTSGSTGKPKGVLHTTAGYLLNANLTYDYLFGGNPEDIYWCTADVGWITGHTYIVYGPLSCGATVFMFEGIPTYPDAGRCWDIVDRHQISIFFTAPTAIRSLMQAGDHYVSQYRRSSLRLLGTVGEPINPEAWRWYYEVVGDSRCSIVDTWWQTETGAAMIAPVPGITPLKPGSATKPMLGVLPVLLDESGAEIEGEGQGYLAIKSSWPSQVRSVYGNHSLLIQNYFSTYKGYYFTGDGAKRDKDGYWWITGRVDDVLNVSGHRLGTAEVESALVAHRSVAEAAVVGYPHPIKGEAIYAYVTLVAQTTESEQLSKELRDTVSQIISPIAKPEVIQYAPVLPKTRSGKIMRRILRKIAAGDTDSLGDITTLADPTVVQALVDAANHRSA